QEQAAQAERDEVRQQRAELRAAYLALAERQDALREQVEQAAAADGPLDRQQRAAMIGLGQEQADVRGEAQALGEQAGGSLLFEYLHGQIDTLAERAAQRLRRASVEASVARDQARVARMLRDMAAALDEDEQQAEFAGQPG